MTPSQKLRIEASEKRQRLNDILALENMDAEEREEMNVLTKRMQEIEVESRAAIILEAAEVETHKLNEPDAENRERLELRSRAQLSNYFTAAARGHLPTGPEAELQAAAKVNGGIPLELWGHAAPGSPPGQPSPGDPRRHRSAGDCLRES